MKINVIIPCGGNSTRTGLTKNKVLQTIGDKDTPILVRTITPFLSFPDISRIILPSRAQDKMDIAEILKGINQHSDVEVVLCKCGDSRTKSVLSAMKYVEIDCDIVVIHDGARPFVTYDLIESCINSAVAFGSGVASLPMVDTVGACENNNMLTSVPDRSKLVSLQTPQAFNKHNILKAYLSMKEEEEFTDDASVYIKYVGPVNLVTGDVNNKKITYRQDLDPWNNACSGIGYDVHRLVEGRELILGGVKIKHDKGLLGHSDADVVMHAAMDAILSAIGEKDIGHQFPDTDPQYEGADSTALMRKVRSMYRKKKMEILSLNIVIMAEKPKLAPYIRDMKGKVKRASGANQVNIVATTTEGIGFIGREEGIAANAIVTMKEIF